MIARILTVNRGKYGVLLLAGANIVSLDDCLKGKECSEQIFLNSQWNQDYEFETICYFVFIYLC